MRRCLLYSPVRRWLLLGRLLLQLPSLLAAAAVLRGCSAPRFPSLFRLQTINSRLCCCCLLGLLVAMLYALCSFSAALFGCSLLQLLLPFHCWFQLVCLAFIAEIAAAAASALFTAAGCCFSSAGCCLWLQQVAVHLCYRSAAAAALPQSAALLLHRFLPSWLLRLLSIAATASSGGCPCIAGLSSAVWLPLLCISRLPFSTRALLSTVRNRPRGPGHAAF